MYCGLLRADLDGRPRSGRFSPQITERDRTLAARKRDSRRTRDLADVSTAFGDLRAGLRWLAFEQKPGECPMENGAGADAFDDFLADVAAFGEVEGVLLLGLLGKVALG